MELAVKSLMGYKVTTEETECTHVVLSVDEYNLLAKRLNQADTDLILEKEKSIREKKEVQKEYDNKLDLVKADFDREAANLRKDLESAKEETEYQKNLNANLLRISKERANAERKLQPKREHSGYAVLYSHEKRDIYKKMGNKAEGIVWETVLQTPFSTEFTEEIARKEIKKQLLSNEGGWLLGELGINKLIETRYLMLVAQYPDDVKNDNIAYSMRLRANYKQGYWEYIVLHTKPIGKVPKNMLP